MVRRVTTETLQNAQRVCTYQMTLWLTADEHKSSVYSIEFSSQDAVKTTEMIGEYLDVRYESTACRPVNRKFISTNSYMVRIFGEKFREVPVVRES